MSRMCFEYCGCACWFLTLLQDCGRHLSATGASGQCFSSTIIFDSASLGLPESINVPLLATVECKLTYTGDTLLAVGTSLVGSSRYQ